MLVGGCDHWRTLMLYSAYTAVPLQAAAGMHSRMISFFPTLLHSVDASQPQAVFLTKVGLFSRLCTEGTSLIKHLFFVFVKNYKGSTSVDVLTGLECHTGLK